MTGKLPDNWSGQASRSLRARVKEMVENAKSYPEEWASLPPLRTRICFHPQMKHPYFGTTGVIEVYAGPYQAPFKTTFIPAGDTSDLEEYLFRSFTGELRSEGRSREIEAFVDRLIVDDELDHL